MLTDRIGPYKSPACVRPRPGEDEKEGPQHNASCVVMMKQNIMFWLVDDMNVAYIAKLPAAFS